MDSVEPTAIQTENKQTTSVLTKILTRVCPCFRAKQNSHETPINLTQEYPENFLKPECPVLTTTRHHFTLVLLRPL